MRLARGAGVVPVRVAASGTATMSRGSMTGTQPWTVQTASTAAVARAMAREDDLLAAFTDE